MTPAIDSASSFARRGWLNNRLSSVSPQSLEEYENAIVAPKDLLPSPVFLLSILAGIAVFFWGSNLGQDVEPGPLYLLAVVGVFLAAFLAWAVTMVISMVLITWLRNKRHGKWAIVDVHPEAQTARQAMFLSMAIIDAIRSSRTWTSRLFDEHQARIDLDATRTDIVKRALRIDTAAAQLPPHSSMTAQVKAAAEPHVRALSAATDALIGRVMALDDYRLATERLDLLLERLARTEQASMAVNKITALDPSVFNELYRDAGINDWHAHQMHHSAAEVADIHRSVQFQIQALRDLSAAASLPFPNSRN